MSLLALLVTIPLGDILSKLPRAKQQVPQAYTEDTRLPGKPPAEPAALYGSWQMEYSEDDAQVRDEGVELLVKMVVQFNEDGTYRLRYDGRWGNPPNRGKDAAGVTIDEQGTFKLSRDVLILDPVEVTQTDIVKTRPAGSLGLANEKHVLVIHWEPKRIHLAGRCAPYQVDPICTNWRVENAWFTLKGPDGKKLGR